MEKHYVCPVCGGVSSTPKNCDTQGCSLKGQPMRLCTCTDGKHEAVISDQL
ncbi:MAG: hypothetical protein WDN47_00740 [Candidatus Doudnabacteria bacterium]